MESIDYTDLFVDVIDKIMLNTEIFEELTELLKFSNYLQVFVAGLILAIGVIVVMKGLI